MAEIYDVVTLNSVTEKLKKMPLWIVDKLQSWIDAVGHQGLSEVRKIRGYHDEPLKGKRHGQRSIRLSRAYRAIYTISTNSVVEFVEIQEVSKHEY